MPFAHILLPTDGSDLATAALLRGIAFATAVGARVTMIGVVEPVRIPADNPAALGDNLAQFEAAAEQELRASMGKAQAGLGAAVAEARMLLIRDDDPAGAIVRAAKSEGCDLIAMASHGRRGLIQLVLGSQTQRVVATASLPVLVLR